MVEKVKKLTVERLKQLPWNKIFQMFYIEPVVFVLVFANGLSGTIMRNQVIYQACTTVFVYNETDCQQLGTKDTSERLKGIETEIQPYVANFFMMRTLLESIAPAICGVFVGSWSDHYGRKPLLLVSMIGFSLSSVIACIISEISNHIPVNPWYYIIAAVPHSILGGNCVFAVAAFCFISDITDTKTRPYRMIFMEAFFFIGLTGGSLLSSFVYAATNATFVFTVSGLLMIGATVFIAIYVPESLNVKKNDGNDNKEEKRSEMPMHCEKISISNEKQKELQPATGTEKLEIKQDDESNKDMKDQQEVGEATATVTSTQKAPGLFSYMHIKEMLVTCFKPRPQYDRSIIWLVTGTMFLSIFVLDGAMTVFYLFVREKFHWTVRDYTFYETISHMITMLGALVGFLIMRKLFNMSVVTLAILAFFSDIISSITRGVASDPWHLYLAIALGAFRSMGGAMCRTIVSNIVPPTDLGKIFSIKNVLQSFAPFVAAPLYTYIYKQSLATFPGLFNIVSAALYAIAFIFMIVVLRFKYAAKEHYAEVLK